MRHTMALALRFFITCLVLMACIVASVDAEISCRSVASCLYLCISYLTGGEHLPPCCQGIKQLNNMAQTTPDRQQACICVQQFGKSISGFKPNLASGLPEKCGISMPYPISLSINCYNVRQVV